MNRSDLPGVFTRKLIKTYMDAMEPKGFLTSLSQEVESNALAVDIAVRRGTEKIAVDVQRGDTGNRNQVTRSTEHSYIPPFFNEYLSLTTLENYNRTFGKESTDPFMLADLISEASENMTMIANKIQRSVELQWSQVFQTGIVTLINGDNIDYRRKAASILDTNALGGGYWDNPVSNIKGDIEKGCDFLRQTGKVDPGAIINAVLGRSALNAFLSNTGVLAEADTRYIKRLNIGMPTDAPKGSKFHGEFSAGDWVVHIYSYPDYYDLSGVSTPYIDTDKVIMWPSEGTAFTTAYGGTPMIKDVGGNTMIGSKAIGTAVGKFNTYERLDTNRFTHEAGIMSAPLAIPVSVDKIYTMKVLA